MAAEIERKFRLEEPPSSLQGEAGTEIEQGYLAIADGVEVRLRKAGDRRRLTVKRGSGEVREEVEIEIAADQFDALWPLTAARRLRKTRYLVPLGSGLRAEVDVFAGDLEGLVTAEVEFDSEQQSRGFQPPSWLGKEITGDQRFANQSLALPGPRVFSPRKGGKHQNVASRSYRLKTKEGPAKGVRRIAVGRTEKALERLEGAGEGELATAIHGARKDLKKLRGVLRLVRDELGKKTFTVENRRYRDAGRLLAGSRDAEVKLETLLELRRRSPGLPQEAAERWAGLLETERDRLAAAMRSETGGRIAQAREAIEAGRAAIPGWALETDSWSLLEPGLTRGYRGGRRAMKRTLADPAAENVHEWRKRAKDLWYQLRILRDAWPELLDATIDQAHELTDLLGDHHDLAVLAEDLRSRPELNDHGAFEAAIARRQEELLDAALEIGRRLYAEKPKAFGRRLRGYWLAWRPA